MTSTSFLAIGSPHLASGAALYVFSSCRPIRKEFETVPDSASLLVHTAALQQHDTKDQKRKKGVRETLGCAVQAGRSVLSFVKWRKLLSEIQLVPPVRLHIEEHSGSTHHQSYS